MVNLVKGIIELENYSYSFPTTKEFVLHDITLNVKPGEFVILIGPSGCGKSVLCMSLNGVVPRMLGGEVKGRVFVAGKDVHKTSVKDMARDVVIIYQNPDFQLCNILLEDEIAFGLENLCFNIEEIKKRVDEAFEFTDLGKYRKKETFFLSGGEKQKAAIASVLAMSPKVLILDEPTSNLDPVGTQLIFDTVEKIRDELNVTLIMVEHKLDELVHKADRLVVMDKGAITCEGHPRKVLEECGNYIMKDLGLWLPQVTELGLEMKNRGFQITEVPLTLYEAVKVFRKFPSKTKYLERENNDLSDLIINVEDLHFTYPDGTKALKGVDMQVEKGDIVALLGQNGSGKTTLAMHFVGIYKPNFGRAIVDGLDTTKVPLEKLVDKAAYVFQYPEHQFVENTVFREVAYGLEQSKLPKEEIKRKVREMLSNLGLLRYKERYPYALSIGEKRRLSVAAMLVMDPNLIILDEPTYGLDQFNATMLMNYMKKLNSKGATICFITHDMRLTAEYARTVFVLNDGKVAFKGKTRKLFENLLNNSELKEQLNLAPPPVVTLSHMIHSSTIALSNEEFLMEE